MMWLLLIDRHDATLPVKVDDAQADEVGWLAQGAGYSVYAVPKWGVEDSPTFRRMLLDEEDCGYDPEVILNSRPLIRVEPNPSPIGLAYCEETHGRPDNTATVYGHARGKTCIRVAGTREWVYSPHASAFDELPD